VLIACRHPSRNRKRLGLTRRWSRISRPAAWAGWRQAGVGGLEGQTCGAAKPGAPTAGGNSQRAASAPICCFDDRHRCLSRPWGLCKPVVQLAGCGPPVHPCLRRASERLGWGVRCLHSGEPGSEQSLDGCAELLNKASFKALGEARSGPKRCRAMDWSGSEVRAAQPGMVARRSCGLEG